MADPHGGGTSGERRAAIAAAGLAGDPGPARSALGDPDPAVRSGALSALVRSGAITDAEIAQAIADPDPAVRRRIGELSSKLHGGDFASLLSDEDDHVVEAAAFACGELVIEDAAPELVHIAADHHDPLCREAAVAALGVLGLPEALPAVLRAMQDVAAVRRRAVIALANFEGEAVTEALERALGDRDWQVRQAAEDLIGLSRGATD